MGKLVIQKKEFIQLCLKSKYHFDVQTANPEKVSAELDNVIYYFLENNNITESWIKKNVKLKQLTNDVLNRFKGKKKKDIALIKKTVVQEVLNTYYMELLYKKLLINGVCYVPHSLSISPNITWLATRRNIQIIEANELVKLKEAELKEAEVKEAELTETIEEVKTNEVEPKKFENPLLASRVRMLEYIATNKEPLRELLFEMERLKNTNDKEMWHTKADELVQLVSNGDFSAMDWQAVYKLIRQRVKLT